MILNSFALLDAFVGVIRLCVACTVTGLSLSAWRASRREETFAHGNSAENRHVADSLHRAENRRALIVVLAVTLLGLNVIAWPLLYAVLQSYVHEWPGVMCIYGVTRIGAGSDGASRFLPSLLALLQCTKPAIVFLSGAWMVLHLAGRCAPSNSLARRTLAVVALCGGLSIVDAGLESAYLVVPKREQFLTTGCCTLASTRGSFERDPTSAVDSAAGAARISLIFFLSIGLVAALLGGQLIAGRPISIRATILLLLAALAALPISSAFVWHVAAPSVLNLPYHHCAYCLMAAAPESVLGIGALLVGCFSIGWLALVRCSVADPCQLTNRLLFLALVGFLGSLVLFSAELVHA